MDSEKIPAVTQSEFGKSNVDFFFAKLKSEFHSDDLPELTERQWITQFMNKYQKMITCPTDRKGLREVLSQYAFRDSVGMPVDRNQFAAMFASFVEKDSPLYINRLKEAMVIPMGALKDSMINDNTESKLETLGPMRFDFSFAEAGNKFNGPTYTAFFNLKQGETFDDWDQSLINSVLLKTLKSAGVPEHLCDIEVAKHPTDYGGENFAFSIDLSGDVNGLRLGVEKEPKLTMAPKREQKVDAPVNDNVIRPSFGR